MSQRYVAVKWNANKRAYDLVVVAALVLYLALFVLVGRLAWPGPRAIDPPVLLLRALGTAGYLMLHFVLCIGPLARFFPLLTPVLYNRRHLGVLTFVMGLAHAALAVGYYHGFGARAPLVSLLVSNTEYGSLSGFPFEVLGLVALVCLFLLAATSHDFWQHALGASTWKGLHMLVYLAYALLVGHVALGALQAERSPVIAALVVLGALVVSGLHLAAARREWGKGQPLAPRPLPQGERGSQSRPALAPPLPLGEGAGGEGWLDVGCADDIPEGRAMTVCLPGHERVAVFRGDGQVAALSNVCAHQRGPLGEGKVIDGCVTCPWHGWEYRLADGQAPPPFVEKVPTYRVRVAGRRVLLNVVPLPPGTATPPARIEDKNDVESCSARG